MVVLPEKYTPPPAGLTPAGFLAWIVRRQWTTVLQGVVCDVIWLLGLALTPWAIGRVIDEGIAAGDTPAFFGWLALVLWLQLQHSLIQGLRDRAGILNFRRGYGRVQQVLVHEVTRAGVHAKSADAAATSAIWDAFPIAFVPITVGGLTAAVVSYVVVGVLLLRDSLLLGLLVIVGVPVFSLALTAMVKPLEKRQSMLREAAGGMNAVAVDVVRGIRVVKGIGGEQQALARYRQASQATRAKGRAVAWPMAATQAMNVIISGVLVVGLTGVGAVLVVSGSLSVGELVAFYGYAGFMVLPVSLVADGVATVAQARVGARRIVGIRALPDAGAPDRIAAPEGLAGAAPGASETVGIVTDGVEVLAAAEALRDVIAPDDPDVLVAHAVPFLFSGTLRTLLDPSGRLDDERIVAALRAADVDEVLVSLEDGLDAEIEDRGIVFSGGQRQRLGLARALLRDPRILILVEPTSSVDAATEARVAEGIRGFRRGGTAVVTSSPLMLGATERVVLLDGQGVRAAGTHERLVRDDERYRQCVLRGEGMR